LTPEPALALGDRGREAIRAIRRKTSAHRAASPRCHGERRLNWNAARVVPFGGSFRPELTERRVASRRHSGGSVKGSRSAAAAPLARAKRKSCSKEERGVRRARRRSVRSRALAGEETLPRSQERKSGRGERGSRPSEPCEPCGHVTRYVRRNSRREKLSGRNLDRGTMVATFAKGSHFGSRLRLVPVLREVHDAASIHHRADPTAGRAGARSS
jgi:hypothetical protein